MTDRSKFEQMLEYLISEDQEKARELFHQLVVEKSREIYESILAEDFSKDEEVSESDEEADEENVEEDFAFGEADDEIGGDAADDFASDVEAGAEGEEGEEGADEFGGEEGEGEGDLEDRVVDLEDALDDLRAEFEQLMGAEAGEEEHAGEFGDEFGGDDMGGDDMGGEFGAEEEPEESFMREYIEKVASPKMGDNGANTKSIVAKKNDMGGTTANILRGDEETGKGGTKGGLANPSTKEENFGNVNVPGGNAGKTAFKKREPGHGAEKKGSGDNGDSGAKSPLNGAPGRAK